MSSPVAPSTRPREPEQEISVLRTDEAAPLLRRRMERPGRTGRLVLVAFGTLTAVAGIAEWASGGSTLGIALGAFGAVLLVLGVVQHWLYRRDEAHWPEKAYLWNDGLELVLHNDEVRGASWSDPDLALQLVARRARPPIEREYVLIWLMDSKVPPVEISAEGFDQIGRAAADRGLAITQTRKGSRKDALQLIEIRQGAAGIAAALAKPAEPTPPG